MTDVDHPQPISRTKRSLHVEAQDALIRGKIVPVIQRRDWELLEAIAQMAEADAPPELAGTDPALYATLRAAITRFHLKGWSYMTAERVRQVAHRHQNREPHTKPN